MRILLSTSRTVRLSAIALGILTFVSTAKTQEQVYSENFDTDVSVNWMINMIGNSNYANVFFDYSSVGIPSAPNSTGSTTRGLKLGANLDPAAGVFPSGVSASPVGFGITENFEMRFDMWINFNGPLPAGGNGSTQVGGAGYGTAGNFPNVAGNADCIFIGATGDGGSGSDFRVYSPGKAVSYQDGQYILGGGFYGPGSTDFRAGDTNSGFVYAGNNGFRNNTVSYYATNFPGQSATNNCPAQLAAFPQQTGITQNGAIGMKWRDVSIKKVANIITYSIDGVLIATIDSVDATIDPLTGVKPLGGTNIMFNHYDINATASTDPNAFLLAFTLIDNVRITNFPNVVSVSAGTNAASEAGPTPATFTITRTSAGTPVTVNYSMTGLASNGVDYVTLPGSVTFLANATSTNVTITPIDDDVPEVPEGATLNINPSTNYVGAGNATIIISDNEPPHLSISTALGKVYERTNDYARFTISRLGNLQTSFAPNVSFSGGSAVVNVDFYGGSLTTFNPGDVSQTFDVFPIEDAAVEGNETIVANIAPAGAGEYTIGTPSSATATIIDATLPPETILFSDNLNTDSSPNWSLFFASSPDPTADYIATFAYDYGAINGLPAAPHSPGSTLGLFMTVNKDGTPSAAALNLYPAGQNFSGNYAVRFDMYLFNGLGGSATEYALFGVNHSGTKTNWFRSGGVPAGWTFDGVFYSIETDAAAAGDDYAAFSSPTTGANNPTQLRGANSSSFTDVFKSPPWSLPGLPVNTNATPTPGWAEVELSQIGNILTLKINNSVIFSYDNATAYKSGNILLGYQDAFDSVGPSSAGVIFDNLRVVRLTGALITGIQSVGNDIQIDFSFDLNDSPSSFRLQSASAVTGPYADAVGAVITQLGPNSYRATIAKSSAIEFYRIRHN